MKVDKLWLLHTIGRYAESHTHETRNDNEIYNTLMRLVNNYRYANNRESDAKLKPRFEKWKQLLNSVSQADWNKAVANPPGRPDIHPNSIAGRELALNILKQQSKRARKMTPENDEPKSKRTKTSAAIVSDGSIKSCTCRQKATIQNAELEAAKQLKNSLQENLQNRTIENLTIDIDGADRFSLVFDYSVKTYQALSIPELPILGIRANDHLKLLALIKDAGKEDAQTGKFRGFLHFQNFCV